MQYMISKKKKQIRCLTQENENGGMLRRTKTNSLPDSGERKLYEKGNVADSGKKKESQVEQQQQQQRRERENAITNLTHLLGSARRCVKSVKDWRQKPPLWMRCLRRLRAVPLCKSQQDSAAAEVHVKTEVDAPALF